MLPDDADWHSDDGNEEKTHDWFNAIMRSVDAGVSPTAGIAHPAPTGTTLPWGGGRIVFFDYPAGLADNAIVNVDDTFPSGLLPDYTNREIIVLAFGAYNTNRLPGSGSEDAAQPGYDYAHDPAKTHFFTKTGAAAADPTPTGGPYLAICSTGDDVHLYMAAGTLQLVMANRTGATIYPFLVYFVSDQFPTRT